MDTNLNLKMEEEIVTKNKEESGKIIGGSETDHPEPHDEHEPLGNDENLFNWK